MVMHRLSGSSESESLRCHMAEGIYFSTANGMRYVYSTLEAGTYTARLRRSRIACEALGGKLPCPAPQVDGAATGAARRHVSTQAGA